MNLKVAQKVTQFEAKFNMFAAHTQINRDGYLLLSRSLDSELEMVAKLVRRDKKETVIDNKLIFYLEEELPFTKNHMINQMFTD